MIYTITFLPDALTEYKQIYFSDLQLFRRVSAYILEIIFSGVALSTSRMVTGPTGAVCAQSVIDGYYLVYKIYYPTRMRIEGILFPSEQLYDLPALQEKREPLQYKFPDGRVQIVEKSWFKEHYKSAGSLSAMAKVEGIPVDVLQWFQQVLDVNLNDLRKNKPVLNEQVFRIACEELQDPEKVARRFQITLAEVGKLLQVYGITLPRKRER